MTDSWKTWLWRTIVTAAVIIVFAAGFYAEENSRGVRAWQKCEREVAARGESLDWNIFVPAPVPDKKNFYQARKTANAATGSGGIRRPKTGSPSQALVRVAAAMISPSFALRAGLSSLK